MSAHVFQSFRNVVCGQGCLVKLLTFIFVCDSERVPALARPRRFRAAGCGSKLIIAAVLSRGRFRTG